MKTAPPPPAIRERLHQLREQCAAAAWQQYKTGKGVFVCPSHIFKGTLSNPGAVAALSNFAR